MLNVVKSEKQRNSLKQRENFTPDISNIAFESYENKGENTEEVEKLLILITKYY